MIRFQSNSKPTKKKHVKKNAEENPFSLPKLSIPTNARINRDLVLLSRDPPPGIAVYVASSDSICGGEYEKDKEKLIKIVAEINGPEQSPFANKVFTLSIQITPRYPFEPPRCRFTSPIFHPNIDAQGRICLDALKMPPAGSWSPALSLPSLLLTIKTLMSYPNADDGLVPEIADLYKRDHKQWFKEAKLRADRDYGTNMTSNVKKVNNIEGSNILKEDNEKLDRTIRPVNKKRTKTNDDIQNEKSVESKGTTEKISTKGQPLKRAKS